MIPLGYPGMFAVGTAIATYLSFGIPVSPDDLPAPHTANAPLIALAADFENGSEERWVERGFPSIARTNRFSIADDAHGNHYLHVESDRSSSGRGVHLSVSVDRCPSLSWRWRVSNTIAQADLSRRETDDAAARLYLIFDGPSFWNPLDKRILVYIWDHIGPIGRILPNPWLPDREHMIVLESAASPTQTWLTEIVDLPSDFAKAFPGELPGRLEAIVFIADTDNTESEVSSDLDDVVLACRLRLDRNR